MKELQCNVDRRTYQRDEAEVFEKRCSLRAAFSDDLASDAIDYTKRLFAVRYFESLGYEVTLTPGFSPVRFIGQIVDIDERALAAIQNLHELGWPVTLRPAVANLEKYRQLADEAAVLALVEYLEAI